MTGNIKRDKDDIYYCLDGVRKDPKEHAHEFVGLLEGKTILDDTLDPLKISKDIKSKVNERNHFCKEYIIHIFKTFIFDDDDVEIMLVSFNYHPDFEHITKAKYRWDLYAREVYEPKHSAGWGDTPEDKARGFREEEIRIMKKLSEILAELAVKQGGTLNLIEDVLTAMESSKIKKPTDNSGGRGDDVDIPQRGDSTITEDQQDEHSEEKIRPGTPVPPPNPQAHG